MDHTPAVAAESAGTWEQMVPVAGSRLHCRFFAPAEAAASPTLIFLHDALGSVGQWRDFPEALARRCRLPALVCERRGHGRSSPLPEGRDMDYLHREALDQLPALLDALDVDRPLLIGHSDGGSIALIYAAHYRPAAVVTLAAHVIVEAITLAGIRQAGDRREELLGKLRRHHGPRTEALYSAWADTWLRPGFRDWDITGLLPRIVCPALVIQGRDDEYGSERQVRLLQKNVSGPVSTLLIGRCGHAPHRQMPGLVTATIANFIARLPDHAQT